VPVFHCEYPLTFLKQFGPTWKLVAHRQKRFLELFGKQNTLTSS